MDYVILSSRFQCSVCLSYSTLAVKGLGQYTSKASGVFMMGVFGGAVFPVLQGVLADLWGSWQWTWVIAIVCELVMLYYALIGSNIRDKECITA